MSKPEPEIVKNDSSYEQRSEEEIDQKALTAATDISTILQVLQEIIRATLFYLINILLLRL